MFRHSSAKKKPSQQGFTLIEIMLVLVLIGVMVSLVQFTFQGNKLEQDLKKVSKQFIGSFTIAAEYALLNNLELGVLVEEDHYQFLGFDGENWQAISDSDYLKDYRLPEHLKMAVNLEGLEVDEQALFDIETFVKDDEGLFNNGESFKDSDEEKKLIPQIYILSGGEITPFELNFMPADELDDDSDIMYQVIGQYSLPLQLLGPES